MRRELAALVLAQLTPGITEFPDHLRVLATPGNCGTCWSYTTVPAVMEFRNGYGDWQAVCMEHAVTAWNAHSGGTTCVDCAMLFMDTTTRNMPSWVRNGHALRGTYGERYHVCNRCIDNYRNCSECSMRYNSTTETQCCVRQNRCALCNTPENQRAMVTDVVVLSRYDYTATDTLAHVCVDCVRIGIAQCIGCDTRVMRSMAYSHNGNSSENVCPACVNNGANGWSICGRHGYAYRADEDSACCDPYAQIHSYSYKPNPIFFGDGPMFYGAEIEICTRDTDESARVAGRGFKRHVYLKDDASIQRGFEMVTHPMSYGYWMGEFPWSTFGALIDSGAYEHRSCGIHVHANRAGFSGSAHEHRWLTFFDRNQAEIEKVARRSGSSYAQFGTLSRSDKKDIASKRVAPGTRYYQRYSAVNVNNVHTYEVRIFATTLAPERVQAAIGLVSATVEYTRQLTAREVLKMGGGHWAHFRAWVESRPEYAPLLSEMNRVGA